MPKPLVNDPSATESRSVPSRNLIFTVALNGYATIYDRCVETQKAYAKAHGYGYEAVDRVGEPVTPAESAWLKIGIMVEALRQRHEWIAYIDADCEIKSAAPPIESVAVNGKTFYVTNGFSGRINSGVMIVRNCPQMMSFFSELLGASARQIPPADRALYENGHVIHLAKTRSDVQSLDPRWNNNQDPALDDYVRHYSWGPLRRLYRPSLAGRLARLRMSLNKRFQRAFSKGDRTDSIDANRLQRLARDCVAGWHE